MFDVVEQQAREADSSGFDTVLVMDHFFQLPMLGEPDQYMLWTSNFVWGGPDTVAEALAGFLQPGIDGFAINMPANGHIPGRVDLLGKALSPLIPA